MENKIRNEDNQIKRDYGYQPNTKEERGYQPSNSAKPGTSIPPKGGSSINNTKTEKK